jgi:hypothetical protein
MERRVGLRARTDFRVIAKNGSLASRCRGVEISSGGIIVDRGSPVTEHDQPLLLKLELQLPERMRLLRALARPVWAFGSQQALRFVRMSDVDRLSLAEHLDILHHRGVTLN